MAHPVAKYQPGEEEKRRFAKRLEAFSDVVFGFALAQCAITLEIPKSTDELSHVWLNLFVFVMTFVVIAAFWAMHYRMFRHAFAAERLDVALNFALLLVVATLPFSLQLFFKFKASGTAYAAYALTLGLGFGLLAALTYRGLRKYHESFAHDLQWHLWDACLRHAIFAAMFLISVPLLVATRYGVLFWWLAPFLMIAIRKRMIPLPKWPPAVTAETP